MAYTLVEEQLSSKIRGRLEGSGVMNMPWISRTSPTGPSRKTPLLSILLILGGLSFGLWIWFNRIPDPVTGGKRLSEYLNAIQINGYAPMGEGIKNSERMPFSPIVLLSEEPIPEVFDAIDHVGTRGLPLLARMLGSKPQPGAETVWKLGRKFPRLQRFLGQRPPRVEASHQQMRAVVALKRLGPAARPILPMILPMLRDLDLAGTAIAAVNYVRPTDESDIAQLTNVLGIQRLPFSSVSAIALDMHRVAALLTIRSFGPKTAALAPVLIPYLSSSNQCVQSATCLALAGGGTSAEFVVPILTNALAKARLGLSRPLRPGTLGDVDFNSLDMNLQALVDYGRAATSAIPVLELMTRGPGGYFLANNALMKIRAASAPEGFHQ
jgi:hypothetical protein